MSEETTELKRIELLFRGEIELNNLFIAASLAYFFVVLFAVLSLQIETQFGIILLLSAVMIVWAVFDWRKGIVRKYNNLLRKLMAKKNH